MASATVLLPHPDSPTRPKTSPSLTVNVTSSTRGAPDSTIDTPRPWTITTCEETSSDHRSILSWASIVTWLLRGDTWARGFGQPYATRAVEDNTYFCAFHLSLIHI